jgi:hypothetical protein
MSAAIFQGNNFLIFDIDFTKKNYQQLSGSDCEKIAKGFTGKDFTLVHVSFPQDVYI